ncbi:MAG TPA: ribonuclease Z [Anaerolineaceae bacterium]|nr:ribonuclease Z [Anaerolineaceae bacterium]
MFEIIFLGTSASAPSPRRGLPAYLVQHDEYRFLIDCGEGTQRQILQAGIGFKRLNRILITHGHLDHILGLGGLLSTFMRWETIDRLEIYGGANALERISDLVHGVVLRGARAPMPVELIPVTPGVIFEAPSFTISAFAVNHRGPDNYGYLFEEKGRQPFLAEAADALGVPAGPLRGKLVKGESVILPDGRVVTPSMVTGPFKPGARLAALGDLGETASLTEVLRSVDGLVMEATYLEEEASMARQYAHLTARQAGEFAASIGAGKLILTHLSRRYRDKDILAEAQAVFENTSVARDFDSYTIRKEA